MGIGRIVGISQRNQIYDEGFCISNTYNTLDEADRALREFIVETLGIPLNKIKRIGVDYE